MLTHRASFYTFTHSKFLHREALTHRKLSHREAFTQRSFYTQQTFTQRSCYTGYAKIEKYLLPKHRSQPSCSHYILQFTTLSCKRHYKSILHAAAAARNLDAAIPRRSARDWVAKQKRITHNGYTNCSSKTDLDAQAEKRRFLSTV